MNTDRLRWVASGVIVAMVFGVLVIAARWIGMDRVTPPHDLPMEAIAIEPAPQPAAPPAPVTQRETGPLREARTAATAKPSPPRQVAPPPAPVKDVVAGTPEPTAPAPAVQAEQAADQSTAPPHVEAQNAERYAAPSTQSAQGALLKAEWQSTLLAWLKRYRRYPRQSERSHQEGVVWVRFSVDRQGRVADPVVQQPSGYPLLDEEALATVRRASPLPPPPAEVPSDPVMVLVPINFFLRSS
ncbi:MAG: hypothetical protein GAK28_02824 [Luteibacter sp.]|uniref:energy transducer TonB n=1 Tax=Luteibacter sp. TaxID=1886636 RepID=UPI001382249B|nr:energy transducer TonB [Luteibacter sp.]KAF1005916.1 MAG: hypothetical protein GAK28_02824 [Luteibacter sp.]